MGSEMCIRDRSGSEGGIGLENFQDIKPGDQIEGYRIDQVARTE